MAKENSTNTKKMVEHMENGYKNTFCILLTDLEIRMEIGQWEKTTKTHGYGGTNAPTIRL